MKIAIPSLPAGRNVFETYAPPSEYDELFRRTDLKFAGLIHVTAIATRMNDDLYVDVKVETALETPCSRCLEQIKVPVAAKFEGLFVPGRKEERMDSAGHKAEWESQRVLFYQGGVVDLDEYIVEAITLALPMKPLCTDTCKGICPSCGKNLNSGNCKCSESGDWDKPFRNLFKSN